MGSWFNFQKIQTGLGSVDADNAVVLAGAHHVGGLSDMEEQFTAIPFPDRHFRGSSYGRAWRTYRNGGEDGACE